MKRKNILILQTDQQRYDSLGCSGNPYAVTPNIDALAADGMAFSRHIASNPTCMPSRASLMTGMTVIGHGVKHNGIPLWRIKKDDLNYHKFENNTISCGENLPYILPTMADLFKSHGYKTEGYGKFHLQPHCTPKKFGYEESISMWEDEEMEDFTGPFYGFDKVKIVSAHGEAPCGRDRGHYGRWLWRNHPEEARQVASNHYRTQFGKGVWLSSLPSKLHNSMWLADEACRFVREQEDEGQPFFLYVGFPDPHVPYTAPKDIGEAFLDRKTLQPAPRDGIENEKPSHFLRVMDNKKIDDEQAKVAAQVTYAAVSLVDKAVGQIVDTLKEQGLYDDTIIIFTSDHGDFLGDYGYSKKCNCASHNLLRVPFVLKPAKGMELPDVADIPMSNTDVLPTLCHMIDVDVPNYVQGKDIFTVDADTHIPFVAGYDTDFRQNNFSVYDKNYRYTYYPSTREEELYNHQDDPQELNNLAHSNENQDLCKKYNTIVLRLLAEYNICLPFKSSIW